MLNITNHQGNANQNRIEIITSHLLKWLSPKRQEITSVSQDVETREPSCTIGGNVNWRSHCGKQYGGSLKNKNRTTIWPSNSTSGYTSKGNKNTNSKDYLYPHVQCSIIHNSQDMETTYMSTDGWMDKENVVCIYNGILSAIEKKKILPFARTRMNFETIMLSEISQRKTSTAWSHLYVESTKTKQNKNNPTDTENRLAVARGNWWGRWVKRIKRSK